MDRQRTFCWHRYDLRISSYRPATADWCRLVTTEQRTRFKVLGSMTENCFSDGGHLGRFSETLPTVF
jgi:hypothetical protein